MRTTSLLPVLAACLLLGTAACDEGEESAPETASQSADVAEGSIAHGHAEAVLINLLDQYGPAGVCSGSLIAPTVVLTAGHCVVGYTSWGVVAPFAEGQPWTRAYRGEVQDWKKEYSLDRNDVGVILLDEPIVIDEYPSIAAEGVPHGTEAVVVGRTLEGRPSHDWLFESEPIILLHDLVAGDGLKHPLYYVAPEVMIQQGDSGGPVYRYDADGGGRTIIGVVSATHYVYRIEKQRSWVRSFLDQDG